MKSIIIGTAGHIDHGKTALVKALTGIDADRLAEEKRRGITIDIGFAHADLQAPSGEVIRASFIDVPGHDRFVSNMLAGIGGIDLVLLIIAADESIKPQTREHFDICRLLSVKRGITVLTKSDLVDKGALDVVRLEVEDFVRGSFLDLSRAPIVTVSSVTGAGLDELRSHLARVGLEIPERVSTDFPRLPIDRVFTMKGFGTVVTGTLISGAIHLGDELEIFPQQKKVRVRGVQVHGQPVKAATAGQRTAVNLGGVSVEELARGMTLSSPKTFSTTPRVDVALSLLHSSKPLKDSTRVRFHSYTMESSAVVSLYGQKEIPPGEDAYALLKLPSPALLLPGDRFIIRQFSPTTTVGGGLVLNNAPPPKSTKSKAHKDFLQELKTCSQTSILRAYIDSRETRGISISEAVARTGWRPNQVMALAAEIPDILNIGDQFIGKAALAQLRNEMASLLEEFHGRARLVDGMGKEELRARLPVHVSVVFEWLLTKALEEKQIESVGDSLRLRGRGVVLKDEEAESKRIIETAFSSAGLKVPALNDVLAGLKIDKARAQKIVTLLLRDQTLVKVSVDLVFHASALQSLRKTMAAEKIKSPKMDVSRFKDITGVSRKYAIPLLEFLDREHVTQRVGNERVIL